MAYYNLLPIFFPNQEEQLSDKSDDIFIPEVDLSDKPWFTTEEDVPSFAAEAARNLSQALANIDDETRVIMGHHITDMLQGCEWDGQNCSPR